MTACEQTGDRQLHRFGLAHNHFTNLVCERINLFSHVVTIQKSGLLGKHRWIKGAVGPGLQHEASPNGSFWNWGLRLAGTRMLSDNPLRNRWTAGEGGASLFALCDLDTGDKGPTFARDFRWRSCWGTRRCLIFSPRMFLVHLRWRLRMGFSV